MEVYSYFLLIENEVHEEEVVDGHERYGIDEAPGVQEALKVIILFVLFDVLLQFVHVEVALGMPELVLVVYHVIHRVLPIKAPVQIEFSSLEGLVINQRKDVRVGDRSVDHLLPQGLIHVLLEKQVVHSVEKRWIVKTRGNGIKLLLESLVKFWVPNTSDPIGVHQMGQISVAEGVQRLEYSGLKCEESLVLPIHPVLLAVYEGSQDVRYMVDIELPSLMKEQGPLLNAPKNPLKLTRLEEVESLSETSKMIGIEKTICLDYFLQVSFVMRKQLV